MHTDDCDPLEECAIPPELTDAEAAAQRAEWMDWWPEGAPSDQDVSALSATIITPIRLLGEGPWLGIWGNFRGLRIAYRINESFLADAGTVVRYPDGVDLNLTKNDSLSGGLASMARFKSREAAQAWVNSREQTGWVQNDRTVAMDPIRQPDSYRLLTTIATQVAVNTTGVKATATMVQDSVLVGADFYTYGGGAGGVVQLRVTRTAVVYIIGTIQVAATANSQYDFFATSGPNPGQGVFAGPGPVHLLSGDVLDVNVSSTLAAGGADIWLSYKRERAAF